MMDKQVHDVYANDDVRNIPLLDRVNELKEDIAFG